MNKFTKITQTIAPKDFNYYDLLSQVFAKLNTSNVYSYLVLPIIKQNEFVGCKIEWTLAQHKHHNTILVEKAIETILCKLNEYDTSLRDNKPICFEQPSLELMQQLYRPLMHRLVAAQLLQWPQLEYEDLMQICMLSMVKLYKKGYYIHKSLLTRTFYNDVLMYLRPYKREPQIIVSLDALLCDTSDDNKDVNIIDTLVADDETDDETDDTWPYVKPILLSIVTERQLQQLLLEYGTKNTTTWSRKLIQRIKAKFKKENITRYTIYMENK